MSKILQQGTVFNDIECLHQAITESGLTAICNENYDLLTMEGFNGQTFQANVGIKKDNFREVTEMFTYGDLGFVRPENGDGNFTLIADDMLAGTKQFGTFFDNFSQK